MFIANKLHILKTENTPTRVG